MGNKQIIIDKIYHQHYVCTLEPHYNTKFEVPIQNQCYNKIEL